MPSLRQAALALEQNLRTTEACAPDFPPSDHIESGFQGAHAHWPRVQGARPPLAAARVGHLLLTASVTHTKSHFLCVPNISSIARSTSSAGPGPPSQARNSTLPAGPV